MKKKLIPLLAFGLVGVLAACSTPKNGEANVFIYQYSDTYITTVRTALESEYETLQIKATFQDAQNIQQTQTQQIDAAIAAGSSLLVVNTVDVSTGEAVLEKAKTADTPVIFFNREVSDAAVNWEKAAFIGTDPDEAGVMQGEILAKALIVDGKLNPTWDQNGDGKINYVMLRAEPGNPEADGRTKYSVDVCNEALEEAGLEPLNLLTPAFNANWNKDTAQQTTANWISTYGLPGESGKDTPIELVIANNDDMALGAIAALGQKNWNVAGSNNKVLVIGVDATAAGLSAIQEGTMYGTVKQDGEAMAKCIAALSKNALDGKDFLDGTSYKWESESVRKIRIPYSMITAE